MPVLSIFFGIIVRMWHDDHPPPHIHVEYQGYEALVDISSGEGLIMMTKILSATHLGGRRIELSFSDGVMGVWDAEALLARTGPLLVPLQDQAFFERFFIDAGALCWPHGLELSPDRLREQVQVTVNA